MQYADAVIRLCLAGVLIVAALGKLAQRATFVETVRAYGILPRWCARPFASALPAVELCLAAGLIWGLSPWSELAAAALFALFTTAILLRVAKRRAGSCGCGLGISDALGPAAVLRNLFLIVIAVAAAEFKGARVELLLAAATLLVCWMAAQWVGVRLGASRSRGGPQPRPAGPA